MYQGIHCHSDKWCFSLNKLSLFRFWCFNSNELSLLLIVKNNDKGRKCMVNTHFVLQFRPTRASPTVWRRRSCSRWARALRGIHGPNVITWKWHHDLSHNFLNSKAVIYNESDNSHMGPGFLLSGLNCIIHFLQIFLFKNLSC